MSENQCKKCGKRYELCFGVEPKPNNFNVDFLEISHRCPFCNVKAKLLVDFSPVNEKKGEKEVKLEIADTSYIG